MSGSTRPPAELDVDIPDIPMPGPRRVRACHAASAGARAGRVDLPGSDGSLGKDGRFFDSGGSLLRRVVMAFTIATAGTAAMVGTAQAATLSINPMQACYISGEKAVVSGAGFTPSGQVNATFAGQSGVFNVDAAGNSEPLNLTFPRAKGITTETIPETDTANPAIPAALAMTVTSRHVDVNPTHGEGREEAADQGLRA